MENNLAIKAIVEKVGLLPLSKKLGVSYQAVQKYLTTGKVSADRVIACCESCNFEVTPHELRPDIYPHPQDGLPDHMRDAA